MPSYGFGRALSSPNPLMVLGQGVMGFGRALYENDLDKKARTHALQREQVADQRYNEGVARDEARYQDTTRRADAAESASNRRHLFSLSLQGLAPVGPVADAGADISEALESTQSFVPLPVQKPLGFGAALRDAAPTYSDGETSFRYDPLMDRGRVQAEEQYTRTRQDALADDAREFSQAEKLARLQASLARGNASHAAGLRRSDDGAGWSGPIGTSDGYVQVNRQGQVRPLVGEDGKPLAHAGSKTSAAKVPEADKALQTMRALSANPSPAGDVAIMYNFMKMLDDQSAVRGEELDLLRTAGSTRDRLAAEAEKARTGGLTPQRRAELLRQAEAIANARRTAGGATQSTPSQDWKSRAAQLRASGKNEQQIVAQLRAEGLVR